MIEISSVEDIAALTESFEVECKLATGRDGRGSLPKDFWETYSAFANSHGGEVFLGIKELPGQKFDAIGIVEIQKVLHDLWTSLNNPQKVSANLLTQKMVQVLAINGVSIIRIHVPRAARRQRPVYLRGNPLIGTYRRLDSSDCLADEETVRRMLAEQVEDSRDNEILTGYGMDDIDTESFNSYRRLYASQKPDHPWNEIEPQQFLRNIGGWRLDRESRRGGLTRAGLLMFGTLPSIQEAFPLYMLDYQERPEAKAEARWVDRLTLDGSWSGNLFDFYRKVMKKLTADLKVPFHLAGDKRRDDTPVHEALREALVNTLVHADYTGRASVLVVKRPDMFGFRNPGLMRVPQEVAIQGGESDCRNRLIHQMFRYIGLGEQAGSGIPKIYQGWNSQHWRLPLLYEKEVPNEQTLLELHTLSLVPDQTVEYLRSSLGAVFDTLTREERLILITAQIEKTVDHGRVISMLDIHPHDLTKLFSGLTEKGLLNQEGTGRGTIYFRPEARFDDTWQEFLGTDTGFSSEGLGVSDRGLGVSSEGLGVSDKGLGVRSRGWRDLEAIAAPIAAKKRAPKAEVERVLLNLCSDQPLTLEQLTKLLKRSADGLRKDYLQPLIKAKKLRYRYPTIPNHPEQAYFSEV